MQASITSPFFQTNFFRLRIGAERRLVDQFDLLWGSSYTTRISRDPKRRRHDSALGTAAPPLPPRSRKEDDSTSDTFLSSVILQYSFSDVPRRVKLEFLEPVPADGDATHHPSDADPTDDRSKEIDDGDSWCGYDESERTVLKEVTLSCDDFDRKKKIWRGNFVVGIATTSTFTATASAAAAAAAALGCESNDSSVDLRVTLYGSLGDERADHMTPTRHGKQARRPKTPRAPKKNPNKNNSKSATPKFPSNARRRLFM